MEIGAVAPALAWLAVAGMAIAAVVTLADVFETVFDLDLD